MIRVWKDRAGKKKKTLKKQLHKKGCEMKKYINLHANSSHNFCFPILNFSNLTELDC